MCFGDLWNNLLGNVLDALDTPKKTSLFSILTRRRQPDTAIGTCVDKTSVNKVSKSCLPGPQKLSWACRSIPNPLKTPISRIWSQSPKNNQNNNKILNSLLYQFSYWNHLFACYCISHGWDMLKLRGACPLQGLETWNGIKNGSRGPQNTWYTNGV